MKNYWLGRLKIGKTVKYVGPDPSLSGKTGKIVSIYEGWIDVDFEFINVKIATRRTVSVEKENLEAI